MKEAYFKGISWTRTFVTGPLDPEHNKYKFYCQIRKIVRHFQAESHLRKDQRWRFEHLRLIDKVAGQIKQKSGEEWANLNTLRAGERETIL